MRESNPRATLATTFDFESSTIATRSILKYGSSIFKEPDELKFAEAESEGFEPSSRLTPTDTLSKRAACQLAQLSSFVLLRVCAFTG